MSGPVVVGYDGSLAAWAALEWGAAYAAERGLPLRVVHAPAWPIVRSGTGVAVLLALEELRSAAERLLQEACAEVAARHRGLQVDFAVTVGDAVPVLLREATDASVLVIGSRGLGEFRDLAAGSVMSHLTSQAPCPVVVVPARWEPAGQGGIVTGAAADRPGVSQAVLHHAAGPVVVVR